MHRTWIHRTLILLFCAMARAATFEGTWESVQDMPGGAIGHTFYLLHQQGDQLTGTVEKAWGDIPIQDGKIDGNQITFSLRHSTWTGVLDGAALRLKQVNGTEEVMATPGKDTIYHPAKLPVPGVKDLPWNKLGRTPPMGWNSWNRFHSQIDDKTVREIADAIVRNGMKDAGYLYVNIDDTWEGKRDAQGRIHTNPKFPDMKALAAYVHGKGLLLGIYSSPGPYTCGGYEGSYGHEQQDAETYDDWGIDYLKYDWCSARRIYSNAELRPVYQKMGEALRTIARPIVFSFCEYGFGDVWTWGPKAGANLWRTTDDISENWKSLSDIGFSQSDLSQFAAPGHWNDPDMLEVGNGSLTPDENRTHFSLWAMLAAPLMAGNDLRSMPESTLQILTNKEVIRVDQDKLGKAATRFSKSGDTEIWSRPMADGGSTVALFNRGEDSAKITVRWADFAKGRPTVRDLWKHEFIKITGDAWETPVPKHGVVMLRIIGAPPHS